MMLVLHTYEKSVGACTLLHRPTSLALALPIRSKQCNAEAHAWIYVYLPTRTYKYILHTYGYTKC